MPTSPGPMLKVIACGAAPAADVGRLVDLALAADWEVEVVPTPSGLDFIDVAALEGRTGVAVRTRHTEPDRPTSRQADAFIVAPATFNTVNKLALGISDTYALHMLATAVGRGLPVAVLPFVNTALAGRAPFRSSVEQLRAEGVSVLLGPGGYEPHEPGVGAGHDGFPWAAALDAVRLGR
ncbi:MAG: flavoprotein [Actinomycetota bacterium]